MNWEALKSNWLFLTLIAAGLVGYMEIKLHKLAQAEFSGLTASSDKIAAMEKDIADQALVHREDRDRMDGKIERIIDILLEE